MEKRNLQFKKHSICEMSRNGDYGIQKMYSFKDICDFMNIEPKERTRIGRKVKPYAEKIELNEDDKEKTFTYVTKTGVLYMIRCLTGVKKYLYYYLLYNKLNGRNLIVDTLFGKVVGHFNLFKIDQIINIKKK